jgi:hypothetical protein
VSYVGAADFVCPTTVLLDGVDISDRCYRAAIYSDGTGVAHCYAVRPGANGEMEKFCTPGGRDVARELLTGKIQIIRPSTLRPA